jgi:hypothetical protein
VAESAQELQLAGQGIWGSQWPSDAKVKFEEQKVQLETEQTAQF